MCLGIGTDAGLLVGRAVAPAVFQCPSKFLECCLFSCGVRDSRLSALILLVHTIVWALVLLVVCSVSAWLNAPRGRGAPKVNRRAPMVGVALWLIWGGRRFQFDFGLAFSICHCVTIVWLNAFDPDFSSHHVNICVMLSHFCRIHAFFEVSHAV